MNKITYGMTLVMLIFAIFTVPALAANFIYIEPSEISCDPGEEVTDIWVYVNATDPVTGFQLHLKYADDVVDVVNVTSAVKGTNPSWLLWNPYWKVAGADGHHYLFVTGTQLSSSVTGDRIELAKITLKGLSPGTRTLDILTVDDTGTAGDPTMIVNISGGKLPYTHTDGTFTCGGVETFTKSLPAGWNLISLPFEATDNSTGTVLSTVTQNAVKQYNAVTKVFEDAATMDPGTGYFVHVTTADTWEYVGTPESSTTTELKSGLNMIGVPNCAMSVSDAMGSTDYRYAARWNATSQSYEVYNPAAPAAFHGFTTMEAGEGYFVSAVSDSTLTVTCP